MTGSTEQRREPAETLRTERIVRQYTEKVLDYRQMELETAELGNKRLLERLGHLSRESSELKAQLLETRDQLKAKNKDLKHVRTHGPRLQAKRNDITEAEAKEAYRSLCDKVQRWVQDRLPTTLDLLFSGKMKKPSAAQSANLLTLVREPGKSCLAVHESEEYHVTAAIMYYLWLTVFSKPFYCPLDDSGDNSTLTWIAGIERSMAKSRGMYVPADSRGPQLLDMLIQVNSCTTVFFF